ncbi:phosphoribosyltransferase [Sinorhizobium meliloti]|uniref:ComF family protein n=1 Tax=Rhizobium meliloti TaxID=382 RepID=UPI00237F8587|nr:phosphoribosyltransferase family protein [Sinorhizobium meliloti]MDE3809964.1 phosphoribosyltransferase [Sinorhizobium meliloti]
MKVHFICGYYSDLAHTSKKRPEDYWDAYFYVWAVKVGKFRRSFFAHKPSGKIRINRGNFELVRQWFGDFIVHTLKTENETDDVLLIPVPSKDGVVGEKTFRTLEMVREALSKKPFEACIFDGIRWKMKLQAAHEGGGRSRAFWRDQMVVDPAVEGRSVVLIDDVLSTGSTLLAARDALTAAGATVLGAVTCGRTIYDLDTKPFGLQEIWVENELSDYSGNRGASPD